MSSGHGYLHHLDVWCILCVMFSALKSSLLSLYASCNSTCYSILFLLVVCSQKSFAEVSEVCVDRVSNTRQVSPRACSLLSAAGASWTGTENNWNVCAGCNVPPKFLGCFAVIETLVIQDLQHWIVFIDLYTNPATSCYILGACNQYSRVRTNSPKNQLTTHFCWFLKSLTKVAAS